MKKDYLMEDGKVRRCDLNISKMSIPEYMYFYVFHWGRIGSLLKDYIFSALIESLKYAGVFIINLILFICTPILLPFTAYKAIKQAKLVCEEYEREKGKQ